MAGQGVATGKISLAVELIDNYKQIASQLKNGLKGNLKDYELDVGFNDKKLAEQAESELGKINELLSNSKFKDLDWSNVIPPLTQVLADGDLAESVKVQIIEGFRRGIEEIPYYYSSEFSKTGASKWEKIKPGEEIAQQILGASIFDEAIESFGMGKRDTQKFKAQYRNVLGQHADETIKDIVQMMSNVSISTDYKDVMPYMIGGTASSQQVEDLWLKASGKTDSFTKSDLRRAAALTERLKYIAKQNPKNEEQQKAYATAENRLDEIISAITNSEKGGKYTQEDVTNIIGDLRSKIEKASKTRDDVREKLNASQYEQKDIPALLSRLREMVQGERSKQIESTIQEYDKANTLDWDQLFNIIAPDEEPVDLRYDDTVTNWLESLAEKTADNRSEEKRQRDDEARRKAQISQAFKNLLNTYGKIGVDSSAENIEGMVDPSVFTDKLEGDVDHLTEQRQEVEKQADELQRAKEELEKENTAIVDVINGNYEQKGVSASKKQLWEKQQAYDEADESNKDLAWIEYYKAYQNMVGGNNGKNMPSNLDKLKTWDKKESLAERLAREFGDEKEFNTDGLREHITNLKQRWIENSTELQNLLKTIAETESQKRAINEQIANIQAEESKPAKVMPESTPDAQEIVDIGQLEQQRKALEEELKELEKQYQEQQELNSAIQDIVESINEGESATKYRSEAEIVLEHMYDSDNDVIRDLAQYWESSGETGASFGALESYGEDAQEKLNNLKEQIEARQEKVKEINETIRQMSSTSIETPNEEVVSGEIDEHATEEQLENIIATYKSKQEKLKKVRDEANKILNDKDNFNPESLIDHKNAQIAQWAEESDVISLENFQKFADSLEQKISYWEEQIQRAQTALNNLTNQNGEIPTESLDESATRATGAVEGLSQAQQQGNQAGQQAADTAQNAANALRAEEEAANADAEAQDKLAASRQNANNAQPPSTPAKPAPAPTPEAPPTHPETPVRTGNVDGINKEAGAAENARFHFMSAAEAKEAFVAANKDANASAEETAKGIDKESQAAENAKLGFDPEKLQTAIDTTQKIHELLTQVSTAINQMDNSSGFTGVTEQLKTVAEAMQLITESAQQVGSAMSAVQAEGGLKVDLQNGLDINPLIGQFETLNEEVIALVASLASVQSAIGAVDDNSGLPNLLSQIQTIADSLQTISQKDLGFNFNISNTGNAIQQQAAKDRQALKELRSQAESLEKYFSNNLGQNWEGMLKRDGGDNYFKTLWSTQDVLDDKKSTNEEKMEAYKRRIDDLKQYAIEAGVDLQSILPKITQAPDAIIDSAKNFALDNSPTELIKQIFGGDNSAVLDAISGKIQEIIGQLNTLNSTLSSLSDGSNLTGLKEVFEQIPQKIEAAAQKIFELRQQIDTAQFSQGFDEQFKGLTEQLEAAKEQTKATNEELAKTKKLLDEETQARKQLQSEVDKHKAQEAKDQQKANTEEKKALEAEKKNLEEQLAEERKKNEARTKAVEKQNLEYQKQQLRQQNILEQDRLKEEAKAKKEEEKAQQKAADESLSKQYKGYSTDVKGALDAKSVQEIDAAAKHVEETKQRILSQASLKPEDNIFGAQLGDSFTKAASQQVESLKAIENAQASYVAKTIAEYEKQKSALEDLNLAYQYNPNDNTQKMQLLTNNPGEEIRGYVENVDNATMALERLKEIVDSMKNGTFNFMDASALKEVLQVREMLSQNVSGAAAGDKAYKAQVEAQKAAAQAAKDQAEKEALAKAESATKRPIADLNKLEKDLEKIKADSEKLVVIDPALEAQLANVEQALEKIRQIKQTLTNEPLKVFDASTNSVTEQVKQDIESVTNTFKTAKNSITESKNLLASLPASFTGYGTAITKLFGEISNPKATTASIEAIYESIKTYTDRISMATNMQRPDFLTGILNENAPDKAVLNQGVALDKVTLGFERFHSQITHEAESTKRDLTKILGEDLFTDIIKDANFEGISGVFSQGSLSDKSFKVFKNDINSASESFKEFQKVAEKLQNMSLEEILGNPDIIKEYVTNLKGFEESLDHIKNGAKNFSIVDPSELQKQRAIYQKFLNDNPAISSSAKTEMSGLISQLQTGINSFDASNVVQQLKDIANAEKEAGNTGGTFISMLTERFKSLGAYLLSFVSFYRVIGVFKDGINIIHELDDALTEMQKVSDESLASLKEYQKTTFATANDIGTTAVQLQQSTADWMRLGEDLQTASQSAQTANVLFNVSEFDNINDATTALVAMSAAYADAEKDIDKMDIVDRLNLIGNNYAIATDELATALQDGAATLQTAGKQHCQNL